MALETRRRAVHIASMPEKHPKRPRDLNQWAKRMVDIATMDEQELAALKAKVGKKSVAKRTAKPQKPGSRGDSS
jgi:hypothetical protein